MRSIASTHVVAATLLIWFSLLSPSFAAEPQQPPTILIGVTPQGENVEPPGQIVFQFSNPVVALGRMERSAKEVAITITPQLPCEWRWLNTSALSCNLAEKDRPKEATRYTISIPKTFDSTVGAVLREDFSASFVTQRPSVSGAWFKTWNSPGRPVLVVSTNQKITPEVLSKHLALADAKNITYPSLLEPAPVDIFQDSSETRLTPSAIDDLRWILTPKEDLPLDSTFSLKVSGGLTSTAGPEPSLTEDTVVSFQTFPSFDFVGVSCYDPQGQLIEILSQPSTKDSSRKISKCDPLNAIQLLFSSPVLKAHAKDSVGITPDPTGGKKDVDPWEDVYSYSQLESPHRKGQTYGLSLPYGLKANTTYEVKGTGSSLRDEFGRTLSKDFAVTFATDHRLPRSVLDNQISVLEKEVDSKLPLIVNNISSVKLSYQAVTSSTNQSGLSKVLTPYKAEDIAYAYPLDVREMLGGRSGLVQGTLTTTPKTAEGSKWFFSQVTPYAVHVKLGHFNSAVWVTSFATGQPIPDAKVSIGINTMNKLSTTPQQLASAQTETTGVAHLPGTNTLDPKLQYDAEWDYETPHLFVTVEKDGEIAFVPLVWEFRAYSSQYYSSSNREFGHIHAWGTTAQGLYKAGDTIQFSLWVRDQNNMSFTSAPQSSYKLEVTDPTGKIVFTVPQITLSEFGGYASSFTTRPDAAVGWYTFSLSASFTRERWEPLRVLVSDFTPASFKVTSELQGKLFHTGDKLTVETQARLHAGGPYSDAATRVTALIRPYLLESTDTRLASFSFDSAYSSDQQIYQKEERLNAQGDLKTEINVPASEIAYGDVIVESAVQDDRGKFVSTTAKSRFIGRGRYVGVAQPDWLLTAGKEATAQGVVIDENGLPVAGSPFTIAIEREETKAVRVKSAGNVYVTKYENEWLKVHECALTSTRDPLSCAFTPPQAGEYRISARVKDALAREHTSVVARWATGKGPVLWNSGPTFELDVIPEKKSYKVGDTARFLVQNPFPGAQALITTERYGIQRSWTKVFSDSTEVIEVPITRDHIPGFYVSVTVVSPRVAQPVEGNVDLGKPAFRLGYARIDVLDPAKQITINVTPSAQVFRPRDSVTVNISGSLADTTKLPLEFAVTVLDEAVFDMILGGKSYFDPYAGFYKLDPLEVKNFNLLRMLVGLQKFEKKGGNPGGDGGSTLDMRSIKKYVSYWNPSVRPDDQGNARISFEAPDNLTGWKVLVMGFTKEDQMGLGTGSFKVNKSTEIRPALPNQVRRGDTFAATFTVMNRSDAARALTVQARAEGAASAQPATVTINAEPFKRHPVTLQATAMSEGDAVFLVSAGDAQDSDSVSEKITVLPRVSTQTAANFGSSDGKEVKESIQVPADIQPGEGSVGVVLSSSIIGNLQGAFSYMRDYPYECWEQKLSKGVMAAHAISLKRYLPKSFEWKGADEFVRATLGAMASHQAPNGGMVFYQPSNDYANQYLSAYTALALTWLQDLGYELPEEQENRLHEYLSTIIKNEEFPSFYSPGMRSSVRAVALAALARREKITLDDLTRYTQAVKEMNVFGKAHYLAAAASLANTSTQQSNTFHQILSFANQSGSTMTLTEPVEAISERILDSNMRTQCAVLDTFVTIAKGKEKQLADQARPLLPKLVRSITLERKRRDRWENTQENLFCLNALARYSAAYEGTNPNLELSVRLEAEELATVTLQGLQAEPIEVRRPLTTSDAGRSETLTLTPSGKGRFYYSSRLTYAPKDVKQTPTNAGLEITREYSVQRNGVWTLIKAPVAISQGELVKVDLYLRTSAPHNFVVVNDPVPGGLEPVNRDLATASSIDAQHADTEAPQGSVWFDFREWIDFGVSFWSFYHKELRHSSARFYSEYLPAGNYHLSYVSQAIASGEFVILPAHAEEMYDPDVFGDSAADTLHVAQGR